ncbi:MAG: recombinase family protein, partial [Anaerolineales bacterium]|nr:recombinase family protein [Anaerolineales bacterium]
MAKRAVIYVRTSSEQQGEKCSPVEQESDCRQFAEKCGLVVVNVYRDIERYRVKKKWVEPSGVRYDRPGLLAMMRDVADDQFDVILAWWEDRLYRGMRAMLLVLETIQQHNLTIMLAQEIFDPATAPLKAWLAQVELENIKERMTMGVKARLKAGKANSGQDRYGYRRVGERIEVVPEEAEWVRQIFAWYIERIPLREMRKYLLAANAPQKVATNPRKFPWSFHTIKGILAGAADYVTGIKIQRREGDRFEIRTEPILDMATYERFLQVRRKPGNRMPSYVKNYALLRGLLYCDCEYRWQVNGTASHAYTVDGRWVKRSEIQGVYFCPALHSEHISPQCPRRIHRREADREVWRQVCNAINHPDFLLDQARIMVADIMTDANVGQADRERIEKELERLFFNRQRTITQARKGGISEEEMENQLNELYRQEVELKSVLTSIEQSVDEDLLAGWEEKVIQYLDDLRVGIQALMADASSDQEWLETFELKQQIVQLLVEKVTIDVHKQLTV